MILTFISCSSKGDFAGVYRNSKNPSIVLTLLENGTYQYQERGKVYNSGNWDYKDNGWLQISFYKWKDIPSFNLRDCKNSCLAVVTYDNGELVFQPDDDSFNFKK